MCLFIEQMEGLRSSSALSVANEDFSEFNKYMHIPSLMDDELKSVILSAKQKEKSLVLVCGNSGDGKSHLIASFKNEGIIVEEDFDIYIDATSSDKKGKKANEILRDKLDEFSDDKMCDGEKYRLIVAINLGVLNDFIKKYESEYSILKNYVESQGLFDNMPSWKYVSIRNQSVKHDSYSIGHVDFTSFHRYAINPNGIDDSFFYDLLNKIIHESEDNPAYQAYTNSCQNCQHRDNCPVYWNYKELLSNEMYRKHIIDTLVRVIIKGNLSPSIREINDFFYEIIIGRSFDESVIGNNSDPVKSLKHFIKNQSLCLLYENSEGLLQYTAKEDMLKDPSRRSDERIISLNLKPDFDSWLKDEAAGISQIYTHIYHCILHCKNAAAKLYKENEEEIKQDVFKLFIRCEEIYKSPVDENYNSYLAFLYDYNAGHENKCKNLIQLVEECVFLWNGRLTSKNGTNIKYGVITNRNSSKFYLFKKLEISFAKDNTIQELTNNDSLSNFSSTMRFGFKLKDGQDVITLDIDYELYSLLREIKRGFMPSVNDRKRNVEYDNFVRKLIAKSNSDTYVYARNEEGKTYRISKDDFDKYTFDYEV